MILAIERRDGLTLCALTDGARIEGIEIDRDDENDPAPGAVYRARVTERVSALGAAFLDLGGARGFLPDAGDLAPGDTIAVQVRRAPDGAKAARLSRDLQVSGRWLVCTPGKPGLNVSRKIPDPQERVRLASALSGLEGTQGFVIRTRAAGLDAARLRSEAGALAKLVRAAMSPGPSTLVHAAPDALTRLLEQTGRPVARAIVDPPSATLPAAHDLPCETVAQPFDTLDLDARLAELLAPDLALAEGWMRIEPTAALVAVDVNTGAARGGEAALRVNLLAASALPRQLWLRKLGGVIAVDFAGDSGTAARKRIETQLRRALAGSPLRARPLGWTRAGLFELLAPQPGRSLSALLSGDQNPRCG